MNRWDELKLSEKAQLLGIYASKGYTDLASIISHYNTFQAGGYIEKEDPVLKDRKPKANFYQRLLDSNRQTMPDWENRINGKNRVATHKLSWATDNDGNAIVYPEVQEINGKLYDFTDPRNKEGKWAAYDRAVQTGDTIQMTPAQANFWTQHYKEFYPSFATGGSMQSPDWDPEHAHIHTQDGKKIIIDPSTFNIDADDKDNSSLYKEIIDKSKLVQLAELHHKDMDDDKYKYERNPAYDRYVTSFIKDLRDTYKANIDKDYYQNYKNFNKDLPEGYTFTPEGVIIGPDGTAYVENTYKQNPRFTYNKTNPLQFSINKGTDIQRNLTFYPVNWGNIPSKYLYDKPIKPQSADYILSYSNKPERYYHTYPLVLHINKKNEVDLVKDKYGYFDINKGGIVEHLPNTPVPNFFPSSVTSKNPYNTVLEEYKQYKQLEDAGYGDLRGTKTYTEQAGLSLRNVKNPSDSVTGLDVGSKLYWPSIDTPTRRSKLLDKGILVPEFNLLDRLH